MKIAYLVNRYPAASHSFIRREIAAIEETGGSVQRFSVRAADLTALPDPRDQAEFAATQVILGTNPLKLMFNLLVAMLQSPGKFFGAISTAFRNCSFRPTEIVKRVAYLAEAAWLARELTADNVMHLHAHFGTNSTMVARLTRKLGGPAYSFTVHGPDEFDRPEELDLRGKIADSAFCVAISSFCTGQLMRWSDVADWPKIRIVRCGVDDKYITERIEHPFHVEPEFCSIARLSGQKGIPLLIEAAARLKREGHVFRVSILGGGELQSQIETSIIEYGLADNVELVGWADSDEVVRHLLSSRAMVLPSFAEGLPVVIMEALALERPVIVSTIAGTPELVDEQCGWLIPSGSVDALVNALKSAINASPEELSKKGKIGRERVVALHNSRTNGAQLFDLIKHHHGIGS